ncbi:MAG: hypothetical protein HY553_08965 [Elusimicrobia bacterium]|nr:hypothetical protein [Elusimicrobiota bacterium]
MTSIRAVRRAFDLLTSRSEDLPVAVLEARPARLTSRRIARARALVPAREMPAPPLDRVSLRVRSREAFIGEPERVVDDLERWWQILDQPNVVGTGVGVRVKDNKPTEEPALLVFVEEKRARAELSGAELIEASLPPTLTGGPAVSVQVYEIGRLEPQAFASREVIQPGYSVGNALSGDTGTLGAIVRRGIHRYLLSNSHVLARSGLGVVGETIVYPGPVDGGTASGDVVAALAEFVLFEASASTRPRHVNEVDAALAEVHEAQLARVRASIRGLGRPSGRAKTRIGMRVVLSGRTSGITRGSVLAYPAQVRVDYPGVGLVAFSGQAVCTRYTQRGDSGALVLEAKTKKVVGLHFSGSSTGSAFTPISTVLERLNCQLVLK